MDYIFKLLFITWIHECAGVSLRRQLEHIQNARRVIAGSKEEFLPSRRTFYQYDPKEVAGILGVPSMPSHLPEAEAILPGHTLLRPSMGMLKSSVKFPHKDMDDGAGVYGNIDTLGESYGRNERLLYSGFRRSPSDYIMVVPSNTEDNVKPRFKILPVVLDLNRKERTKNKVRDVLKKLSAPPKGLSKWRVKLIYVVRNQDDSERWNNRETGDLSHYLNDNESNKPQSSYKDSISDETSRAVLRAFNKYDQTNIVENHPEDIAIITPEQRTEQPIEKTKLQLFLESKNSFNPVKFSNHALEMDELIPPASKLEDIRQWWFYNQEDFEPFKE